MLRVVGLEELDLQIPDFAGSRSKSGKKANARPVAKTWVWAARLKVRCRFLTKAYVP